MVYYRGVFLCLRCGGHAVQKPRKLAKVCIERLTTGGQAALKRMSKNMPPAPYKQWPQPENAALPYSMRKGSIELFAELAEKVGDNNNATEACDQGQEAVQSGQTDSGRLCISESD